jgi:hypothetical protein
MMIHIDSDEAKEIFDYLSDHEDDMLENDFEFYQDIIHWAFKHDDKVTEKQFEALKKLKERMESKEE